MEPTDKQTSLAAQLIDTVLDFARAHGIDASTALAALDDAKTDAPIVLAELA